jgi:methyl-coenzyme M reductase subunit D
MKDQIHPQCRIVPIRMLQAESAAAFLSGLSQIPGIRRLIVHGPAFSADIPGSSLNSCEIQPPDFTRVQIADQDVDLHVLMADVILETIHEEVIDRVAEYCTDFFGDKVFQILVGRFMKTDLSLADYISGGSEIEKELVGLTDNKERIETVFIATGSPDLVTT